jgi:hypothetical protein
MTSRGYSRKPVLLGRSRGGLMTLTWAMENPDRVGGFAGIYPVCNIASYPGIEKAAPAYGLTTEQLRKQLAEHNPVDRLEALGRARVALFAIHGDVDTLVPLRDNSGLLHDRYAALGEAMELIVPAGQGHNMWPGFFQCQELVAFVRAHAGPNITIRSPMELQVVQRSSLRGASVKIAGDLAGFSHDRFRLEARVVLGGKLARWRELRTAEGRFDEAWNVPAGGWHQLEVRARSGKEVLAESVVEHFGVGEVFVVAGQSNSANHGEENQTTATGLVAAFDGERWQLAQDPQPGASGNGGSFMPPFGDRIATHFGVPAGIVACGVGATSVREWLPSGATFPNPPTLTNHVRLRADGQWESDGEIYARFIQRLKQLGPGGFRAVLWHQGESDANQADASRTLSGMLYHKYLKDLIAGSQRDLGWNAPWFVAKATYHNPADQGSPEIRAAQAALWEEGIASEGPDTDALQGKFRDGGGRGVHFSGAGLREHAARWFEKVRPWLEERLGD